MPKNIFSKDDMSIAWSEGYHAKVDEIKGERSTKFNEFIDILTAKKSSVITKPVCVHPFKSLERNANGIFCNSCQKQVSNSPNIY